MFLIAKYRKKTKKCTKKEILKKDFLKRYFTVFLYEII